MRPHIAAIYAFARAADDFADEGTDSDSVRLAKLDEWERRLVDGAPDDAIFVALANTIRACGLDRQLFVDLLSAFRQDVTVQRYESWNDLLDYCSRSANPVGRLVLGVAGYRAPAFVASSDALCTGLQLANFWQDVERDWQKGRVYVPQEVIRAAGARESDLDRRPPATITHEWRQALRMAVERTRTFFKNGRAIADAVDGRLKWELRATWLGGVRVLDRLEAAGYDVFARRPSLGWKDAPAIAVATIAWRRGGTAGAKPPR